MLIKSQLNLTMEPNPMSTANLHTNDHLRVQNFD